MDDQFILLLSIRPYTWRLALTDFTILAGSILAALLVHYVLFALIPRFSKSTRFAAGVLRHTSAPMLMILIVVAISAAMPKLDFGGRTWLPTGRILEIGYIISLAWLAIGFVETISDLVKRRLPEDLHDNLQARRRRTQIDLLRQISIGFILFAALTLVLLTFPQARSIGAGLFASAGLAGLALGMAARPTLGNLIAGIQVALTEPIRIGDMVVVEGEWGRIAEVNTTFVVLRLWDLRHMIVPLSYFIERPFQNWTRYSSELVGSVLLYVDYTVPLDELRREYERILKSTPLWDGKVMAAQVTDAKEHTLEIRFLVSASNPPTTFDLRCLLREKLVVYLQQHHPQALPRYRSQITFTEATRVTGDGSIPQEPR